MTLYQALDVSAESDERELRRAYRAAVRRWHPDRDASAAATPQFLAAQRAWHVLGDPDRRAAYDAASRPHPGSRARVVFVRRTGLLAGLRRWWRRRRRPARTLA